MSLWCIMESSTQDPHIKKKHTKFFKILKFGVYQAVRDTAIEKLQNLKGNDIQDNPYNYFKVSFFCKILNGCFFFNTRLINTKLEYCNAQYALSYFGGSLC